MLCSSWQLLVFLMMRPRYRSFRVFTTTSTSSSLFIFRRNSVLQMWSHHGTLSMILYSLNWGKRIDSLDTRERLRCLSKLLTCHRLVVFRSTRVGCKCYSASLPVPKQFPSTDIENCCLQDRGHGFGTSDVVHYSVFFFSLQRLCGYIL